MTPNTHKHEDEMSETTWRDISSAPRDGTVFLAYYQPVGAMTERVHVVRWKSRGISVAGGSNRRLMTDPTHWMPLPPPPTPNHVREE